MTQLHAFKDRDDCYVVFSCGISKLSRYMKPGFGHVYVFMRDKHNWSSFNPTPLYCEYAILPFAANNLSIHEWVPQNSTILKISYEPTDSLQKRGLFGLCTCVSAAQYILGTRLFAITPYMLYKKLTNLTDKQRRDNFIRAVEIIKGV